MASPIKRNHWAKCWWNNRNNGKEHPFRTNLRSDHRTNERKALLKLFFFYSTRLFDCTFGNIAQFFEVKIFQNSVDSFSSDRCFKTNTVFQTVAVVCDFSQNFSFIDVRNFAFCSHQQFFQFCFCVFVCRRFYFCFVFVFKIFYELLFFFLVNFHNNITSKVNYFFKVSCCNV